MNNLEVICVPQIECENQSVRRTQSTLKRRFCKILIISVLRIIWRDLLFLSLSVRINRLEERNPPQNNIFIKYWLLVCYVYFGGYLRSSNWVREHVHFEERDQGSSGPPAYCELCRRQANPNGEARKFKVNFENSALFRLKNTRKCVILR